MSSRSLLKEARRLYRRALEINPRNAIAGHALAALEANSKAKSKSERGLAKKKAAVPAEASKDYVGALFDS